MSCEPHMSSVFIDIKKNLLVHIITNMPVSQLLWGKTNYHRKYSTQDQVFDMDTIHQDFILFSHFDLFTFFLHLPSPVPSFSSISWWWLSPVSAKQTGWVIQDTESLEIQSIYSIPSSCLNANVLERKNTCISCLIIYNFKFSWFTFYNSLLSDTSKEYKKYRGFCFVEKGICRGHRKERRLKEDLKRQIAKAVILLSKPFPRFFFFF